MEPTQTLHIKSPLASPDSFKHLSKRIVKFDYKKVSPMTKGMHYIVVNYSVYMVRITGLTVFIIFSSFFRESIPEKIK